MEFYKSRASLNGLIGVQIISGHKIREYEPNVIGKSALLISQSGIIDVSSYLKKLESLAEEYGVTIFKRSTVLNISANSSGAICEIESGDNKYSFIAETLINASGLSADRIAKLINPESPYEIQPILGEYATFNCSKRGDISLNGMNVYKTPQYIKKDNRDYFVVGVHFTPTFEMGKNVIAKNGKTVLVGPTALAVSDDYGYGKSHHDLEYFLNEVRPIFPGLLLSDLSLGYSGIRAKLKTPKDDFVIKRDDKYPNCINVMADSPGLTSSLSIAKYLIDKVL